MAYKGIVRGRRIELEDDAALTEGTHVTIMAEEPATANVLEFPMTLQAWLQKARKLRAQLPETSDSVEILRPLREGRAGR
jgi:hypothetical protein